MPNVIVMNNNQDVTVTPPPSSPTVVVNNAPLGTSNFQSILDQHIISPTPHPAYDIDIPSLQLLFENGLT